MRRIIVIFFALICLSATVFAVGASPRPISVVQPDGAKMTVYIHGDEYGRWLTDAMGVVVERGADGFYRPVFGVTAERMLFLREQNLTKSAAAALAKAPAKGKHKAVMIPVEFSDVSFSIADIKGYLETFCAKAGQYFEDNIPGSEFVFDVASPVKLGQPLAFYGANVADGKGGIEYDVKRESMILDAMTAAMKSVRFKDYDLNGDDYIDFVMFCVAGCNEAEAANPDLLWPVFGQYSDSWRWFPNVLLGLYGIVSELMGEEDVQPLEYSGIGTFCHEYAHSLGLLDLYDVDYSKNGTAKALWGTLSLMDYGNYNDRSNTPPYFCAIDRELLGILDAWTPAVGDEVELEAVNLNGKALRFPTTNQDEYFLVETRIDEAWDRHIGGRGMLVYLIDKSKNIADGIQAVVRWNMGLINASAKHECADLVEAFPYAEDVDQVFFPGRAHIHSFSTQSVPPFIAWSSDPVGLALENINLEGDKVRLKVEKDDGEFLMKPADVRVTPYQNAALVEWQNLSSRNLRWEVEWRTPAESEWKVRNVGDPSCVIDGLEMNTVYEARVYQIGRRTCSDTVRVNFTTTSQTSPYPAIHGLPSACVPGDSFRLMVYNVEEDIEKVEWACDGVSADPYNIVFNTAGTHTVTVTITYSADHSQEVISQEIKVDNE